MADNADLRPETSDSSAERAPDLEGAHPRKRRRRGGRGRGRADESTDSSSSVETATSPDLPRAPRRPSPGELSPDIFDLATSFGALGLKPALVQAIDAMGFSHPTHVQSKLIPAAMTGQDILGQSRTGTGKTAAFGIPIINAVSEGESFSGLVLCPTRELAIQVAHELRNLARFTKLHVVPIYGGQKIRQQAGKLDRGPEILVGTPGRIMDFHARGQLPYDRVKVAVLDEVDRMLDIGFREDIRRILGGMSQPHQTIFVSATIGDEIEKLARKYMKDPLKLVLTASSLTVNQVTQKYFAVQAWDKSRLLVHLLTHEKPELTVVFCRMKQTVDALTEYLARKGIDAHAIHGDLHQGKRNRVMSKLRSGELSVLVASDLAARGLDVDDISHVINFDLPEDPEIYVHRIGRTARAGRNGIAWTFVTPEQGELLTNIEKFTNVEIGPAEYADFEPGPVPPEIEARRRAEEMRRASVANEASRAAVVPPAQAEAGNATKFPGGLVPTAVPSRRLLGRVKTRRR